MRRLRQTWRRRMCSDGIDTGQEDDIPTFCYYIGYIFADSVPGLYVGSTTSPAAKTRQSLSTLETFGRYGTIPSIVIDSLPTFGLEPLLAGFDLPAWQERSCGSRHRRYVCSNHHQHIWLTCRSTSTTEELSTTPSRDGQTQTQVVGARKEISEAGRRDPEFEGVQQGAGADAVFPCRSLKCGRHPLWPARENMGGGESKLSDSYSSSISDQANLRPNCRASSAVSELEQVGQKTRMNDSNRNAQSWNTKCPTCRNRWNLQNIWNGGSKSSRRKTRNYKAGDLAQRV